MRLIDADALAERVARLMDDLISENMKRVCR